MKSLLYLNLVLWTVCGLAGCKENAPETPPDQSKAKVSAPNLPDPNAASMPDDISPPDHTIMTIIGKVVYKNLEGGFFAIEAEDGRKYNPMGLPQDFQKDGLRVKVKARPRPDAMSTQMYGVIIEIVNITAQ